jgi:hypothetical protein
MTAAYYIANTQFDALNQSGISCEGKTGFSDAIYVPVAAKPNMKSEEKNPREL